MRPSGRLAWCRRALMIAVMVHDSPRYGARFREDRKEAEHQ
jgi:hypothetical protein